MCIRDRHEAVDKEGEWQVKSPFTTLHSHFHIAHTAHHTWGLDRIMYALKSIFHKILNIGSTKDLISIRLISLYPPKEHLERTSNGQ